MAKVKLNYSAIGSDCIASLDNVIGYLNTAINYLSQTSIPWDFYRRNTLSNTIADLKAQRDSLTAVRNWLVESNSYYDDMIEKLNVQANQLPTYQVKSRTTII